MKYLWLVFLGIIFSFNSAANSVAQTSVNVSEAKGTTRLLPSFAAGAEISKSIPAESIDLNNKGVQLALQNRNSQAIAAFREVVLKSPDFWQARINLAVALDKNQQYDEAIFVLRHVIDNKRDNAFAHAALGETLFRAGLIEEGIKSLRRSMELNPSDPATLVSLGASLYDAKEFNEALSLFDRSIKLNPAYARAHNNRGVVLQAMRKYKAAIDSFRQAIVIDPKLGEAYNNLGVTLSIVGKKEAHKAYQKAFELLPDWNYAVFNLAGSFLDLGKREPAQKLLAALNNIDPSLASKIKERLLEKYVVRADSMD